MENTEKMENTHYADHISSIENKQETKRKAAKNNCLVYSNTEKAIELHLENYIITEKRKEPISKYPIDSTFSAVSFKIPYIHTATKQKHNKKNTYHQNHSLN